MAKNSEEIIERKEGSPVATSCLIIACVAILGAISLQIAEITQVRAGWDLEEREAYKVLHVDDDLGKITEQIKAIIKESELGDGEKAKSIIEEGDAKIEKAKAEAKGEAPVEEDSDSKDEEAPEKGDAEDTPDKEGDASEDSELEDF